MGQVEGRDPRNMLTKTNPACDKWEVGREKVQGILENSCLATFGNLSSCFVFFFGVLATKIQSFHGKVLEFNPLQFLPGFSPKKTPKVIDTPKNKIRVFTMKKNRSEHIFGHVISLDLQLFDAWKKFQTYFPKMVV